MIPLAPSVVVSMLSWNRIPAAPSVVVSVDVLALRWVVECKHCEPFEHRGLVSSTRAAELSLMLVASKTHRVEKTICCYDLQRSHR